MNVVSLADILSAFNASINEEQCWALCHQSLVAFRLHFAPETAALVTETRHLLVQSDGTVLQKSLSDDASLRPKASSESEVISSLGVVLFRALDYGLRDDEERSLSAPLEALIDRLTGAAADDEARDEGIECETSLRSSLTFDDVIQMCCARVSAPGAAESHYRAVCRALVAETLELTAFLEQIQRSDTSLPAKDEKAVAECLELGLDVQDWARLWVHVIRQLRDGVQLRAVPDDERQTTLSSADYELTPFERLLNDIRFKRYSLNKVELEEGRLPPKDAHALILDFIRSRPPLVPASRRQLAPAPDRQETLYEKLMQSIRQQHKLRPTPRPPTPPLNVETSRTRISDQESTPAPQRRLIKANLNLRLSFESFDDENDDKDNTEGDTHVNNAADGSKFSLRKLSRLLSQERRHSISVCESPRDPPLDVNEDARQHVVSIWESCEWGRALQCLSLTLQEVQHIRSVLTKAELETLAVTKDLRHDLENGKICFTCLKTRFSFFGQWPKACKLCERAICDRCATKMHIPFAHFDKVPIYMLSPTPSPPDPHRPWPAPTETAPPPEHRPQMETTARKRWQVLRDSSDRVVVDAGQRKAGPRERVCRDCKRLVRHLIDTGSANWK